MPRYTTHREQFGERVDYVLTRDTSVDLQGQPLAGVLIHNRQPRQLAAAYRPVAHEVPEPHVVQYVRTSPVASIRTRAQATLCPVLYRHFQPLRLPLMKHSRQPRTPPFFSKQQADPAVPISRLRPRELKHPLLERRLVRAGLGVELLTGLRLIDHHACPSLGDAELWCET